MQSPATTAATCARVPTPPSKQPYLLAAAAPSPSAAPEHRLLLPQFRCGSPEILHPPRTPSVLCHYLRTACRCSTLPGPRPPNPSLARKSHYPSAAAHISRMNFKGPAPTPTPWRRHHRRAAGPRAPPAGRPSRRAGPLAGGAAHPGLRQPSPHPIFRHLGRYRRRPPLYCATSAGPKTGPGPPAHVPVAPPLQRQRHRASRRRHNPRWPRDRAKPALPPPLPTRARDHPAPCNRDYDCTRPGTLVTTSAGSTPARVELALPSTLPARQRARHPRHNISRLHARLGRARAPIYNDCTKPGTLVTTSPGSTPARAEPALPSTLPARQCACTLPVRPRPRPHRRLHGSPAQPIASHETPPFPPSRHSRPPAGPRSRPSISPNLISARPAAEAHPLPSPPPPAGGRPGPASNIATSRENTPARQNCAHPAPAGISALNRAPSTTPSGP